jgi:hypothetical protein
MAPDEDGDDGGVMDSGGVLDSRGVGRVERGLRLRIPLLACRG